MTAEPPRPSFTPQPVVAQPESRVIVIHHGGPSFFSTYWMLRLGIVALVLIGSGGRWMIHHFGGTRVGDQTLDAFDDPAPAVPAAATAAAVAAAAAAPSPSAAVPPAAPAHPPPPAPAVAVHATPQPAAPHAVGPRTSPPSPPLPTHHR